MSEPYTLDADLYPDTSNIVTEDDTSKHDFPSDIDLSPDISHIITEDDTPGDNFASEKLQRLLVESLYNAWTVPSDFQIFLAAAFEGRQDVWLRWCNREGNIIPAGTERAQQERQRAEQERQRAERLVERLRTLGVNPD